MLGTSHYRGSLSVRAMHTVVVVVVVVVVAAAAAAAAAKTDTSFGLHAWCNCARTLPLFVATCRAGDSDQA